MFAAVEMPDGTSANRTQAVVDKLNAAMMENIKGLQSTMAITGFSPLSGGSSSSAGMIVVGMKDWSQREDAASSINAAVRTTFGLGAKVAPEATVIAMNPPALPGLGMTGGWTLQLQDMTGHTETELNDITKKIVAEANQRPELAGVRSTYSVGSPVVQYEVDREKVKNLGIQLSDVFAAMQVNYGGYQVNDFNRFGRSYKVMLQADNDYRSSTDQMTQNPTGSCGRQLCLQIRKPSRNSLILSINILTRQYLVYLSVTGIILIVVSGLASEHAP